MGRFSLSKVMSSTTHGQSSASGNASSQVESGDSLILKSIQQDEVLQSSTHTNHDNDEDDGIVILGERPPYVNVESKEVGSALGDFQQKDSNSEEQDNIEKALTYLVKPETKPVKLDRGTGINNASANPENANVVGDVPKTIGIPQLETEKPFHGSHSVLSVPSDVSDAMLDEPEKHLLESLAKDDDDSMHDKKDKALDDFPQEIHDSATFLNIGKALEETDGPKPDVGTTTGEEHLQPQTNRRQRLVKVAMVIFLFSTGLGFVYRVGQNSIAPPVQESPAIKSDSLAAANISDFEPLVDQLDDPETPPMPAPLPILIEQEIISSPNPKESLGYVEWSFSRVLSALKNVMYTVLVVLFAGAAIMSSITEPTSRKAIKVKIEARDSSRPHGNTRKTYERLPRNLDRSAYQQLLVVELRDLLRARNLKVRGLKAELIKRLIAAYEQELWDLKVTDLKRMLKEKDLKVSGHKKDLVIRLIEAGL